MFDFVFQDVFIQMNRSIRVSVSVVAVAVGLAGCSSSSILQTKKIDYKSASKQTAPSLEIPPDLTKPTRDDRYVVPDIAPRGTAVYSVYQSERESQPTVSPGDEVLTDVENMYMERAGSQRWLVVRASPEKLWPDIKDFWIGSGFILNIDRPADGIMETDWAENRAKIPQDFVRATLGKIFDGLFSTSERDKFRTRIERGRTPGTVEIYVSHRGMEEVFSDKNESATMWQPRPADPELEAEMLRRMMVHLGVEEQRAATILAATPKDERALLQTGTDGRVNLTVEESFDRAWRRVGLALDRVGFTVEDRDRSQGQYFVRYVDPDIDALSKQSQSFWSKLAFWRSSDDKLAKDGSEYRIQLSGQGNRTLITVLSNSGGEDSSVIAKRILDLLYEQLK